MQDLTLKKGPDLGRLGTAEVGAVFFAQPGLLPVIADDTPGAAAYTSAVRAFTSK